MAIYGGTGFVFNALFVLEDDKVPPASASSIPRILSFNVPQEIDGCDVSVTDPKCAYVLAAAALSSLLITRGNYTIAGVTFSSPYGTLGIPMDVLEQFVQQVIHSKFDNERTEYCLPLLPKRSVSCIHDDDGHRAEYHWSGQIAIGTSDDPQNYNAFQVIVNPQEVGSKTYSRTSFRNGTMVVSQSLLSGESDRTVITGSGVYADLLSRLAYNDRNGSSTEYFTTVCTVDIKPQWQWVSMEFRDSIVTATPLYEACTDSGGGFRSLYYALEGATSVFSAPDGYSKYINEDFSQPADTLSERSNSDAFREYARKGNMSQLESILSRIHEIVQTSFSGIANEDAPRTQIMARPYRHRYTITTTWTLATILALVAATTTFVSTFAHMLLWIFAMKKLRGVECEWDILDPVHALRYGRTFAANLLSDGHVLSDQVRLGPHGLPHATTPDVQVPASGEMGLCRRKRQCSLTECKLSLRPGGCGRSSFRAASSS